MLHCVKLRISATPRSVGNQFYVTFSRKLIFPSLSCEMTFNKVVKVKILDYYSLRFTFSPFQKISKQLLVLLLTVIYFITTAHGKATAVVKATTTTTTTTKTASTTTEQKISAVTRRKTEQSFYIEKKTKLDVTPSPNQNETLSFARRNQTTNLTTTKPTEGLKPRRTKRKVDPVCVVARKIHTTATAGAIVYFICKDSIRCKEEKKSYYFYVFRGYLGDRQVWQRVEKVYVVGCIYNPNVTTRPYPVTTVSSHTTTTT